MKDLSSGKKMRLRQGSGTLEILIAFAILILAITAAVSVAFGNQGMAVDTELDHQAFYKASRELENVRAAAAVSSTFVTMSSTATTSLTNEGLYSNIGAGHYNSKIDVQDIDPCTKQVTSTITWQVDALRPQKVEIGTVLTSPDILFGMGGTGCSGIPPLDWSHPGMMGEADPGNAGVPGTDVVALNKNVFLTGNHSSPAKADFFIVRATSTSPSTLSSLDTGPGLNAVAVAGNYAYVANDNSSDQLQVINISNTSNPILVATSTLASTTEPGRTIFYLNSRIYIGTAADSADAEFYVYDVSSPTSPVRLGKKEIGVDVNSIFVRGNTAYLATSGDTQEVIVLNVSDPTNIPAPIRTLNMTGGQNANVLYLLSNRLYVGRAQGAPEFYVLDASNPAAGLPTLGTFSVDADVLDLRVSGNLAFVASDDANDPFWVLKLTDLGAITSVITYNCDFPQAPTAMDFEDNVAYFSVRSNQALRVLAPSLPSCN